jgi:hypothetical protein
MTNISKNLEWLRNKTTSHRTFTNSQANLDWGMVAQAYIPSYSGGGDIEHQGLRPIQVKVSETTFQKTSHL